MQCMTFVDGARPSTVTLWDVKFQRLWDRVTSACSGWAGLCWPQPRLLQGPRACSGGLFPLVVLSGLWTRNTNCALGGSKHGHWLSLSIALCSLLGRYWDDFSNGFETTNQLPRWLLHPWPSTLRTAWLGVSNAWAKRRMRQAWRCGREAGRARATGSPVYWSGDDDSGLYGWDIVHIVHYHHHHWNIQWNQSIRDCWCLAMPFSGRWRRSSCALSILGRDGRKLLPRWLSGRSINYSEVTLGEVSHHIPFLSKLLRMTLRNTMNHYQSSHNLRSFRTRTIGETTGETAPGRLLEHWHAHEPGDANSAGCPEVVGSG